MRRSALFLALLLLVIGAAVACGDDDDTNGTSESTESSTTTSSTQPATGSDVRVYFVRDEKVATGGRAAEGEDVATDAVTALLAGPSDLETDLGMTSEIPTDTELLGIDIADGLATVDVSSAFESGGGSLSMQVRVAQLVFTVTQFDTVDEVTIHLDGEAVDGIGGEGVPASNLDRAAFATETPLILVESPVPGEEVSSPLTISGMSNTFEANVQYEVTDAGGVTLDDGFTAATAGNGTFGTFEITAELAVESAGDATVVAFETNQETGGRANSYEVPVQLTASG